MRYIQVIYIYIYITTTTTVKMPVKEESGIFTNLCASTTIKCVSYIYIYIYYNNNNSKDAC